MEGIEENRDDANKSKLQQHQHQHSTPIPVQHPSSGFKRHRQQKAKISFLCFKPANDAHKASAPKTMWVVTTQCGHIIMRRTIMHNM